MAKVSKKPAPGVSEEERKRILAKLDYDLRENKKTGDFYTVKKRQTKKVKREKKILEFLEKEGKITNYIRYCLLQ